MSVYESEYVSAYYSVYDGEGSVCYAGVCEYSLYVDGASSRSAGSDSGDGVASDLVCASYEACGVYVKSVV